VAEAERRAADAEARAAQIDADRAAAEEAWKDAEARAEEAIAAREDLAALLEAAKESVRGMHDEVDKRLAAIEAKRTRTTKAWEEAEARATAAIAARDALAAELEALRTSAASDPDADQRLAAAAARIRELELQLFERNRGEVDKDVELEIDAAPAPVSELAGKRAMRYEFKPPAKIKIDRGAGLLVDLSVTGAQVISADSPDVGEIVTLALLSDDAPCFCQGRVLWARREQTAKGKPFRYRAGIVFTAAEESDIEAYIKRHAAK
jgi:ketosteroid isomerase-like protein